MDRSFLMAKGTPFKLTYATMFNPPEELHARFEDALAQVKDNLGKEYSMFIDGGEKQAVDTFENRSPINTDMVLGIFQKGNARDAGAAVSAAKRAFPAWSTLPWKDRLSLLRKAADIIDERVFEFAAVITLEVGKNRMEALGDAAEAADLIRYACGQIEANDGFVKKMGEDPLQGYKATNYSILRPYGVWLIISPFNFPAALTGGPAGAALAAGNTIVIKPASDTPWTSLLLAECFRDAGLPAGVFNYVTGPGSSLGQALIDNPDVDGVTFTGSFDIGMGIYRSFANGPYVRPTILELGGKNPAIVSANANVEDAAVGIVRSAFGLQGQKCSACSRVYIEKSIYQKVLSRILELTRKLEIGDPTKRSVYLGPVVNKSSYQNYQDFVKEIRDAGGRFLAGGEVLTDGDLAKGYYCAPTIVVDLPLEHRLWKQEMFVPITTVTPVGDIEEAMAHAVNVKYGLTAGFYGSLEESKWFFEHTQAGVNYANRPQGATTGAWPGFQPFGGWKGSGSSGKNAGGLYYVQLYMHEQIQTLIQKK
jgi:1-pyrroline-5-carboxylate dehydrogenase